MQNLRLLSICYLAAYAIVTIIGVLHAVFNIYIMHYKSMKDSPGMGEAYEKTKPFHPVYNLLIFPLFAWLYLSNLNGGSPTFEAALLTGLIWGTVTIIIDLIGWVLIRHPWSLTFKEFYLEYQPWITFTYIIIYLSPLIAYGLMQL